MVLWQNCGFYTEYIDNTRGVHALEHGAVWITYDPDLPQDQIDHLEDQGRTAVRPGQPYPGMDAPVIASVWGKQIKLDGAFDDRLDPFISRYRKNPDNSPEPNGICWSGVSATTDDVPQQEPYVQADPNAEPIGGITAVDATATAQAQNRPAATPTEVPATTGERTPAATPDGHTSRRYRRRRGCRLDTRGIAWINTGRLSGGNPGRNLSSWAGRPRLPRSP